MNRVTMLGRVLILLGLSGGLGMPTPAFGQTVKDQVQAKSQGTATRADQYELATFAGGCFWCMEPPFTGLDGVIAVTSGYTGGHKVSPTYEEVSDGGTGHAESVEIKFDPGKISYEKLLNIFWHNIDPTSLNREFVDVGTQYRTAIFYHSPEQKRLAEASKVAMEKSGRFKAKIVTEIVPASTFYPAEQYHQHYFQKNPIRYKYYRYRSGRDQYLDKVWGVNRPGRHS